MKKKDILFLCQFFYPEYVSSATLPFDTAKALKEAGFRVDALCGYPKEYSDGEKLPLTETVEGMEIRRLKYLQLKRSGFLGRLINYFSFTFMVFLNLWRFWNYRAVVVYSNPPILPWIASWGKKLFGTKLFFVAYDLYPEIAVNTGTLRQGNLICRLMNHINKVVYPRIDGVIALSEEMKDFIGKNRNVPEEKIHVIPNWYADEAEIPGKNGENSFEKLTQGRFTVSYFGNMGTAQDMDTILGAIRLLKGEDICFLFAGHGNKMQSLKNIVREEKLDKVFVYDFLRDRDFRDALAVSGCALVSLERGLTGLCVPSKTYSYMQQGIPLLAIMEAGDIVRDIEAGAGCWVRNGEAQLLAEYILQMRNNPERRAQMSRICRELYLKKYTTETCTARYAELMKREVQ